LKDKEKTFHDLKKTKPLKELMNTKPALQRYLKELYTQKRKINTTMRIWEE
jgi:hypothetical protein